MWVHLLRGEAGDSGFGAQDAVLSQAVTHLRVRCLAAPAAVLLFVTNGAFRGFQDTRLVPLPVHLLRMINQLPMGGLLLPR